jgi:hypothetical protein
MVRGFTGFCLIDLPFGLFTFWTGAPRRWRAPASMPHGDLRGASAASWGFTINMRTSDPKTRRGWGILGEAVRPLTKWRVRLDAATLLFHDLKLGVNGKFQRDTSQPHSSLFTTKTTTTALFFIIG